MRRSIAFICSLFVATTALPAATTDIKVMSFNVRTANAADGANDWDGNRKNLVVQVIRDFAPDLLGIQEDLERQKNFLDTELTSFNVVGSTAAKGGDDGEYCAILYRHSRFTQVRSGQYWLSETPNVAGSSSWNSELPRKVTWVELVDNNWPGFNFVFMNTHWDHVSAEARQESAALMRSKIRELSFGIPVIVTGDFNADQDGTAYNIMTGQSNTDTVRDLVDTYREIRPGNSDTVGTAHGFDGTAGDGHIDWILHDNDFNTLDATIVRTEYDGRYPSDHFPITATITPIPEPAGLALIGIGMTLAARRMRITAKALGETQR